MPWFNNMFAFVLSDPRDVTPAPYLIFYANMNISSTFLLPIIFIVLLYVIFGFIAYLKTNAKGVVTNTALVVYNYFLGGLSFASVACIQGALLNPMDNNFGISSAFYLFGIILFLLLLVETVWSITKDS